MGQINQPLWRAWGGAVTHDHQLMGNGMPRSNVAGPIPGGTKPPVMNGTHHRRFSVSEELGMH